MKHVKLIHPGWLAAPNGANTVMNSLLDSKKEFGEYGIVMASLTPDLFSPRAYDVKMQKSFKFVLRFRLRKWLKALTKYSRLASDLIVYITELRPSQNIARRYVDMNPDEAEVSFFHMIVPCYYYLKLRKKKQFTVVVCHNNGDNFKMLKIYYPKFQQSLLYKKMLRMEKYVIEHVDRINFVASLAKDNFLKLHPEVDSQKVSFIYNGVPDIEKIQKEENKSDAIEFVCVASISKRKGQNYIIEALKIFNNKDLPNVHFTFVGDGIDRGFMENDVRVNQLENYISFVGVTRNVDKYLANSNVFILPSEDEGLPMSIIEAMRASLPIVSTPVGGIPEMINHEINGLLIQPNANDIYNILCHLDQYDWEKMGIESRKTYETKFSINKMIEGYAKLLNA